jgi:hypothetical protein
MTERSTLLKYILRHDESWCNMLGIFNPYIDPFPVNYVSEVPMYDLTAYEKYPHHNFVYDKLWIAKSQGIACGVIDVLTKDSKVEYPIFIKPRWGHQSASSKNCFKIKSYNELKEHKDKEDMIWTEFIDDRETMTDFIMLDGKIVYQLTSIYSDVQNGFIDDWKSIDEKNRPPEKIVTWVRRHMKGYTGICNAQYRGDKIIEISLRLSRGGAYFKSTDNPNIVENVNNIVKHGHWDYSLERNLSFTPYFSYKCYTNSTIISLLPQHLIDAIMKMYGCKDFYEYFFEPSGKQGMAFFQFFHEDFEKGMRCKAFIERLFSMLQYLVLFLMFAVIISYYCNHKYRKYILWVLVFIIVSRFINPLSTQYALYKAQKQQWG